MFGGSAVWQTRVYMFFLVSSKNEDGKVDLHMLTCAAQVRSRRSCETLPMQARRCEARQTSLEACPWQWPFRAVSPSRAGARMARAVRGRGGRRWPSASSGTHAFSTPTPLAEGSHQLVLDSDKPSISVGCVCVCVCCFVVLL